MANPFQMFRKNQKVMMAVLTILAMFAFVFLGTWSNMGGSSSAMQNPEVFSWKYGAVHKSDMQDLRIQRQWVRNFLLMAMEAAGNDPRQVQMFIEQAFPTSDQALVQTMVLAKKANELGIVISDESVNDFIRNYTNNQVRPEQLSEIISNLSSERRSVSPTHLFDAIKYELAALKVQQMFAPLLARGGRMGAMFRGDTPADRWDYFCRLNRKVTAEMMPVSVEKFVGEVPDPSDAQLHGFYDQYKDALPQPGSPTPGFKQPQRVQFQYFKADNDKLVADELPKVTQQEIKDYYDRYKDVFFKKSQLPDEPETGAGKASDKSAETKASDKGSETKSGGKSDSNSGSKSSTKPDNTKPDNSQKSNKKQSRTTPASSLDGELLALADGPEFELAQASKTGATKTDGTKADVKSDTKPADSKKSDAPQTSGQKSRATPAAGQTPASQTPAADTKGETAGALPQRPVEYEPLSKVSDRIRNSVAQQKVEHKVDDAFTNLRTSMDQYGRAMDVYHRNQTRGDTTAKPPAALDFATLAKQQGLEAKQTEMITDRQAYEESDIGKSHQLLAGTYNITPFVQMGFQPNFPKYQAQETEDLEKNRYLWWKIADEPMRVPSLDDVKPEVTRAWKMIEARKNAQAKAEEYASEARRLQKPLKEIFGKTQGADVLTAGPFSWMSRRTSDPNAPPSLTEVSGVKDAGSDFMKSVFALQAGQAGVAVNQPLTIYYVVQVESEEPPQAELRQQFITSMETPAASSVYAMLAADDSSGLGAAWFKQLQNEFDFKLAPGQTLSANREID